VTRAIVWSRDALDDLTAQMAYIAADNPEAARRVAGAILDAAAALGQFATGRPGRVVGTYEKPVTGLPYIIAYAITAAAEAESIAILRVIHTARNWPAAGWPKD
jgi:toxin ParE1/3/4